jgi:hypothetical protein
MKSEIERLTTYENWPLYIMDMKEQLAAGFCIKCISAAGLKPAETGMMCQFFL